MINIKEEGKNFLADNYQRFPVTFVRGKGTRLYDQQGKEYLDFVAGIAVCSLGHSPQRLVEAICDQARNLIHVSNLYWTEPQARLAQLLCNNSFAEKVFFCNSGAEAVEAALKLCRRYAWKKHGPHKTKFVALERSFHGRTFGALSATGQPLYWEGFKPLLPHFIHIPPNDIKALEKAIDKNTCGIILEPILGEGGVIPLSSEFIKKARFLASQYDALLIFDEIQVGLGRTGKLFAYQGYGIEPDIMTLAKALAGGLPLGAMLAKEEIMQILEPGTHASTFGGNPVSCAAGIVVLETLLEPEFLKEVEIKGKTLKKRFISLAQDFPSLIKEVRGLGLIQALEFSVPVSPIINKLFERRILVTGIQKRILRVTPPLIVSYREIDALYYALKEILEEIS